MYIEQIRTYEIKKVAFKFNFLFLGYDIGHEKKIKNFVWWETSTFVSSLKFQCFISRIGKNWDSWEWKFFEGFIIAPLTVVCGYVIRS